MIPKLGTIGQRRLLPVLAIGALAGWLGKPLTGWPGDSVHDGWERLTQTQLEAMSAVSMNVRRGLTDVTYHISPSGDDVRAHYPSMFYSTRYRRKVAGPHHCYHPAELPFTGWRCYSVWRKGGALVERLATPLTD